MLILFACSDTGSPSDQAKESGGDRDSGTSSADSSARTDAGGGSDARAKSDASSDGSITPNVTPGGPVLFFSDLVNGPRAGNSDTSKGQSAGQDGAFITIWGKNLGPSQGSSTVTVGGVPARVSYWGPATHGANLHTRMGLQMIELQIPGGAPLGATSLLVSVAGTPSNDLPFTTREAGKIYFIAPNGNDGSDGSWSHPWASWDKAADEIANGDIVYLQDGFHDNSGQGDTGFIGLNSSGTPDLPKAVVAYPGATATIGGDQCEPTGHALLNSYSMSANGRVSNWVISKLTVTSPDTCEQETAVELGSGFRMVGTYVSNRRTRDSCQSGSVQCGGLNTCGNDVFILGNEMANVQTANATTGSKQCHGFYISGNRQENGVESNREIGWNYIHDNAVNRGINIYNEAYNPDGRRKQIEKHKVHDNWMENQRGIGVLMGQDITGDNWLYNNVFVNSGLGPVFPDGGGFFVLQLQPGSTHTPQATTLYVYNNIVYGASFLDGPDFARDLIYVEPLGGATLDVKNNIFVSTQPGIKYINGYSRPFTSSNNLWFGAGAAPASDTSSKTADPLFVNPSTGDFHLQSASPAKTGGAPAGFVPLDFDGMPRQGSGMSLGPYQ